MYVGIDVGTGSLKAVLGSDTGLHTISESYPTEMTTYGIHNAALFIESAAGFMRKIAAFSRKSGEEISGIGLCGHGPSIIIIDDSGNPLTDIVTWQDSSAANEAVDLGRVYEGFSKDGTSFEAKIFRLSKRKPELFARGNKALYPKDFLVYLLTGRVILDYSTAATLEFFDPEMFHFSTEAMGVPKEIFPDVIESWDIAGETGTAYTRDWGIPDGIPVVAGGIDAWCEAVGAGAMEEGVLVDGTGTSTCITCCKGPGESPLIHVLPGKTLAIETMSSTGDSIRWMKGLLDCDLDEFAPDGGAKPVPVIFQPYLNGERSPVWDERACTSITGLTGKHDRMDLVRSILQGISFGTRQCLEIVTDLVALSWGASETAEPVRAVGGGAANMTFLKYKADISGLSYMPMNIKDAAPLGAMILGAYGCGAGTFIDLGKQWIAGDRLIEPDFRYKDVWEELFSVYSEYFSQIQKTEHRLFKINRELYRIIEGAIDA